MDGKQPCRFRRSRCSSPVHARRRGGALAVMLPLLLVLAVLLRANAVEAQIGSDRYGSIVIDAASGKVLEAVNPDEPRYPASLTKMMTLYMLFEALRDRRLGRDELVPVSAYAAAMVPSKLGLRPGSRITVEEAMFGLITKSANDAAAALAELMGGSEGSFAQMMTLRARALGMNATTFRNASGLPDPEQVTTARDMAILARHLVQDFPAEYRYFSAPEFVFHGRVIPNHDRMLVTYPGADGIKTGYTVAAGHNLVTSAVRDGVRLIGVVLGAASNVERDIHMASLLDRSFEGEGVTAFARREPPAPLARIPAFVATAQAATLPMPEIARARLPEPRVQAIGMLTRNMLPRGTPRRWGVQVGSFATAAAASAALGLARRESEGGEVRMEPIFARHRPAWRAQIIGLSQSEAQNACASLARHRMPCIVIRPWSGQLASR